MVKALVMVAFGLALAAQASDSVSDLSWMVGAWEARLGQAQVEEHWIAPRGGTLLGVSRTVAGEKTVAFEFLRIETRSDGIYYVAHPNARPGTDFKLTRVLNRTAVFENPRHDHPKLIRYQLVSEGSLQVRIEGDEEGKHVIQDFDFKRKD